LIQAI